MLTVTLLIFHGLAGVALLGAITHQIVAVLRAGATRGQSFIERYTGVQQRTFTIAIVCLYLISVVLGGIVYPNYRLDVRVPFEQMSLGWAVGLFELKEHFAGIGLCVLPFYTWVWQPEQIASHRMDRIAITSLLAFIVWWDFIVGHVLNNIRGLT